YFSNLSRPHAWRGPRSSTPPAMCCSAGVSPAFLQRVEVRKTAGETPALQILGNLYGRQALPCKWRFHPVRLIFRAMACMILVLGFAWTCERPAAAGPAQEMLPEQSAAKAK